MATVLWGDSGATEIAEKERKENKRGERKRKDLKQLKSNRGHCYG